MKIKLILSALFLSALGLHAEAAVPVRNGCSLFDRYGQLRETYRIETMRDESSKRVSSMTVERQFYYDDLVIYKRGSNELLGDKVQLPIPAFPSFEKWKESCNPSIFHKCDEEEYDAAKNSYEKDPRWTLHAYQITPENRDYYVLSTRFVTVQKHSGNMILMGREGDYDVYRSQDDSPMEHKVFITNANHSNFLYRQSALWGRSKYMDNPLSYSLTIWRGLAGSSEPDSFLTTILICQK